LMWSHFEQLTSGVRAEIADGRQMAHR
jgi:hypothetical protein